MASKKGFQIVFGYVVDRKGGKENTFAYKSRATLVGNIIYTVQRRKIRSSVAAI
jgi:hypothetical protein